MKGMPEEFSMKCLDTILRVSCVKTNIGNGYHSGTGKFTAPMAGLYEFNASFINKGDTSLALNLVLNGQVIARGHACLSYGCTGSLNAILLLQKGDAVYLQLPQTFACSGAIHGLEYSMFSGHQL